MKFFSLSLVGILCIFFTHNARGGHLQNWGKTTGSTETTAAVKTTEISATTISPELPESTDPLPVRASYKVQPSVINFINHRISQALVEHPKKDESDLRLALVFNELRRRVTEVILPPNASKSDTVKAEQTLQRFLDFAEQYNVISKRLLSALEDLISIEADPNQSLSIRFEALQLINKLRNSDTIKNAEIALQSYDDFTCELKVTTIPTSTDSPLPLGDEYKIYFEGSLKIVRQDGTNVVETNF